MPTRIKCAHCGRSLALPDGFSGNAARCGTCKLVTEITPEGKGRGPSVQPPLAQPVAGRSAAGSPAAAVAAVSAPNLIAAGPAARVVVVGLDVPFGQVLATVAKVFAAWLICCIPLAILYVMLNPR